jgi:hypothetical protein
LVANQLQLDATQVDDEQIDSHLDRSKCEVESLSWPNACPELAEGGTCFAFG